MKKFIVALMIGLSASAVAACGTQPAQCGEYEDDD